MTDEIEKIPTGKRIWAVLSHDYAGEYEIITRELESRNGPVVSKEYPGARFLLSVARDAQEYFFMSQEFCWISSRESIDFRVGYVPFPCFFDKIKCYASHASEKLYIRGLYS